MSSKEIIELPHDIRPVWSESSLSAWRKLGSLATHWSHCEDWSDWADAQADLRLHWVHMPFCWFCHEAAHICHIRNYFSFFFSVILQCDDRRVWYTRVGLLLDLCACNNHSRTFHRTGKLSYEPRYEKPCVFHMRKTKVQISLRFRAVWSAPLLFAAYIV